jgi:hypothetical protein
MNMKIGKSGRRKKMKINLKEFHQVTLTKTYDVPDEDIIEEFGSLEAFEELEESEQWDFFSEYDYESEEDWWTVYKGGFDTEVEILEEDEE